MSAQMRTRYQERMAAAFWGLLCALLDSRSLGVTAYMPIGNCVTLPSLPRMQHSRHGMVWTRRIGGNPRKSVLVYRCSADSKDDSSREYGRSGSWTLSRDEEEEREGLLANDQNGVLMSADFQTLHRDLASWHDLYEWFRSYHVLRCESEVGLQLRRDLCEALRLNDLVEAARLREEILDTDSRNDIVRLRDRLDKAVQIEVFSPHL